MKRQIALLIVIAASYGALAQKKTITRAEELPRRTIAVKGDFDELYNDDQQLDLLANAIYRNLLADLEKYDIKDKSTLISYYSTLLMLEYRDEKFDQLAPKLEIIRDLEDKEIDKLTTGLNLYAQLDAMKLHPMGTEAYYSAYGKFYLENLERIPYDKIEQYVIDSRNRILMLNEESVIAGAKAQLKPFFDNGKGNLLEQVVLSIINIKFALKQGAKLHTHALEALNTFTANNSAGVSKKSKENIWIDRKINIRDGAGAHVVMAIWDTGVDTKLFPNQLFTNNKELLNNKDDDGNGHVDDIHGIAFDTENKRSAGDLQVAPKLRYTIDSLLYWTKGSMDLQYGIDSDEAKALQRKVVSIKADEAVSFREDLGWYGTYVHGTHVAGISIEGNPHAKLLNTRISYETSLTPSAPTEQRHQNMVDMFNELVEYWKSNGVRVVNISLRFSPYMYEALLNMHGIGKDELERKATAQRWFQAEKAAMTKAFSAAPEILFICAAGNEANDAGFADYIPASLQLPNLLTVGAVDSEGKRTSFTTEGANIKIFANGYEVESLVPGGAKVKFNGTSMASPQVANLAAKILTVNPSLTPKQVIDLISTTATVSTESSSVLLIHPRNAIEQALRLRKDYSAELLIKTLAE